MAALLVLTFTSVADTERTRMLLTSAAKWAWQALQLMNCALEAAIELGGFIVGRALAQFGNGFVRGYHS